MNALSNQVQLIGHLGADPEIFKFDEKQKVSFRMATNESYKNGDGEWITNTEWHNVVAWGKVSDIIDKQLRKGTQVAISGKLTHRDYEDKEGNKKYVTEIVMKDFMKLSKDDKPF
ncbi:MAG: single-stranded DNA-binding protein [Saprospiraceae bacterium]|nr:single-stranded DNA-binding protein [Saprospiraceae bacterium]